MKPTDYAEVAAALGISTIEAAELEAEWRHWRDLQSDSRKSEGFWPARAKI